MRYLPVCSLLPVVLFSSVLAAADPLLELELADGSRLFATSISDTLPITSDDLHTDIEVPYERITNVESITRDEVIRIEFANGDRLTARYSVEKLRFISIFGEVSIPVRQIRSIKVRSKGQTRGKTPHSVEVPDRNGITPTAFQLDYAGQRWDLWRTEWQVQNGQLTAIGKIRPGFHYGHWGNGRGGMAITGNGNQDWQDYEVAFDFHMKPASRDFFHAHIPGESRGMTVFFRAKSLTESWNEPDTAYLIGVNPSGGWSLAACEDFHYVGNAWSSNQAGKTERLTSGKTESPLEETGNRLLFRVVGTTITLWINDEEVMEFQHEEGGKIEPIAYGGFGVQWRYESLGWIRNLTVKHL